MNGWKIGLIIGIVFSIIAFIQESATRYAQIIDLRYLVFEPCMLVTSCGGEGCMICTLLGPILTVVICLIMGALIGLIIQKKGGKK